MNNDRGAVYVVLGSGAPSCPAPWTKVRLLPPNDYRYTGWALAGGEDMDGDGVADLAVGIPHDSTALRPGRALLVSGQYLLNVLAEGSGEAPLIDPDDSEAREALGNASGGYCGVALAFLADYENDGRPALAMGCRRAKYGGLERAGGVAIFRYTPGVGFPEEPEVTISGERVRPESYGGSPTFHKRNGVHIGLVGAPYGNANGLDTGSAYVMTVEGPK